MQPNRSRLALIGLGLVYATLLANALVGYANIRKLHDNDRWVIHTHEVIQAINFLFFSIVDVETAQRGYVVTGDSSYLAQYDSTLAQTNQGMESLAKLFADKPGHEQHSEILKEQVSQKLAAIQEIVEVRKNSGFEPAQALIMAGKSRRASEQLRETISRMQLEEKRLLADRQLQSEVSYRTAIISVALAGIIGVCLSMFASILVWRDIETRVNTAAELRAINDRLARQAEELASVNRSLEAENAERSRAEAALQEADGRKDQFLATLAHELRNPLSPLLSAAQLLSLEPNSSPEIKEMAAIMLRQVEQLKRLIDDLLDVSRISRGKLQLQIQPMFMSEAVTAALDVARPLMESKGHTLQISLPEQPVEIRGDSVRVAQIVGNLLINAAKYTPSHGKIELEVKAEGTRAIVRVRDNGIGIAPEMLPSIFGLFTQADATTQRSQGGLGIGLSLAKNLVELHGGSIEAKSAGLNQGSEFIVVLPLQNQLHKSAQPIPPANPTDTVRDVTGRLPTYRFLVVDDNQSASHLLSKLLEKLGQEVRIAHSAETALAIADHWHPQVLISDIAMPEVSGYELAERIRNSPSIPRPILIALTGYGQESDRQAALTAGFEEHLTKPIGLSTLQELMERIGKRLKPLRVAS